MAVLIQLSLSGTRQMAAGNMPKISSLAMRENYLKEMGVQRKRDVGKVAKGTKEGQVTDRQACGKGSSSSKWQVAS